MKIEYKFADGTKSIVEVDDNWGNVLLEYDRQEKNNNQTETRRHCSLDGMEFEGEWFSCEDVNVEALFKEPSQEERLHVAISKLKPSEQELIKAVYFQGKTRVSLAEEFGISKQVMSRKIVRIENKIKKLF